MTDRFVNPIIKYTTATLQTMPGALLYFYVTGTTTPKVTYQDFNGTTPHSNPVVALSDGHFPPIFLDGTYRAELKSSAGITQPGWPVDDIGATNDPSPLANWNDAFSYSAGQLVTGPDGNRYESIQNNNLNNDPTAPGSLYWSQVFIGGNVDTWQQLDIAARSGSGPKDDAESAMRYALDLPEALQVGYIRTKVDGTYENRTTAQTKTDLAINNVNNTSDANKPVSTAQQTALNSLQTTLQNNINTLDSEIDLKANLSDLDAYIENVSLFSSFTGIAPLLGQTYYLSGVTASGDRSGMFKVKSGSVSSDGESTSPSATAGLYFSRLSYDAESNIALENYWKTDNDFSGLIQTNGKKVVITGDSLSYNNYDFGFPFAATAQEANPGIRSWGFLLRDAIHMSDPCFTYGDTIPWHINNSTFAAVALNNTAAYILPFNNRSLRVVVSNASAIVTLTVASYAINNGTKQVVVHMAHSPGQPGKFDVFYNDNAGGADVFVQNVQVGNGVEANGLQPFTVTVPVNSLDSPVRIIFKNFTKTDGTTPLAGSVAFYVLATGSKLTNVYTTGVGGASAEDFVANYSAKIGVYAPDLLILSLGANDRLEYTLQRHLDALQSIFASARASNAYVRIILVTSPPALASGGNIGYYPDSATNLADPITMKEWVSAVEAFCRQQNVIFYNLYRFLYDQSPTYLFVDGIHLTRNAGKDVFKSIMGSYFKKSIAPVEHLGGYTTYSVAGAGDLMGRQIALYERTRAAIDLRGEFTLTYTHGTTSWAVSNHTESGSNKPCAFKSITLNTTAHTNILEFWIPVTFTSFNEFVKPIHAVADYIPVNTLVISSFCIKPLGNNTFTFQIRDAVGALIDPATMNGAQFIIKYWQ